VIDGDGIPRRKHNGTAESSVRPAGTREAAHLETAYRMGQRRREYEGYTFAFLIPVDSGPE
jgi:hypothetical protein